MPLPALPTTQPPAPMFDTTPYNPEGVPYVAPTDAPPPTKLDMEGEIPGYTDTKAQSVLPALAAEVRTRFERAKNARQENGVDDQMIRAKRARERQYEPQKWQAIKQLMGPSYDPNDHYVPVIETKCRDLVSWLMAVPADENLWELEPEAMPELPPEVLSFLEQNTKREVATAVTTRMVQSGMPMTPDAIPQIDQAVEQQFNEIFPKVKDHAMLQMKRKAKELIDRLSLNLEGNLDDGHWRDELEKTYWDIATYPAAFLKGPIPQKITMPETEYDNATGMQTLKIVEKVVDTWKRVSPLNMFPDADSADIDDGDLFEVDSISPKDLDACIGLPGYDEQAIRRVLQKFRQGGLHEWMNFDSEKSQLEKRGTQYNKGLGSKLDMVCAWCSVQGKMLIQFGMNAADIPDPEREYAAWIYLIDTEVIMAQLNPNPLGKKPYYKASFIEDSDKFWNSSLPDLLWVHQNVANAVMRACSHNVAFASGPVTEINKDRLAPGESADVYPYMKKLATDKQLKEGGPLLRFYQARLIVGELQQFYNFVMQQADVDSGVPHYIAGGQPKQPGAASKTAQGMQMMRTDAARGLEQVRGNISKGIIKKSIEAEYYQMLQYDGVKAIGGVKVKTRGTEWLAVRDQQTQRINDVLTKSMNPVDFKIFGEKARQELWREELKGLHMDSDKILPEDKELIASLTGGEIQGDAGQPGQDNTSGAGEPNQMMASDGRPAQ